MDILNADQMTCRFSKIELNSPKRQLQGPIRWRLWCKSLYGIPVANTSNFYINLNWHSPLFLKWLIPKCLTWSLSIHLFCQGDVFHIVVKINLMSVETGVPWEFGWDWLQFSQGDHRCGKHGWSLQSQLDATGSEMLLLLGDGQEIVPSWVKSPLIICAF